MGTKDGIRQRRQERIRRIMESDRGQQSPAELPSPLPQPQPRAPRQKAAPEREHPVAGVWQMSEADPEQLWKSQANPWENGGWRIPSRPGGKAGGGAGRSPEVGADAPGGGMKFIVRGLFVQTVIAGALFVMAFALFRTDAPIAQKGQAVITAALTDRIDFGKAAAWYDHVFAGAPSFIPLFGDDGDNAAKLAEGGIEVPVVTPLAGGSLVRTFAETLGGIELAGASAQPVLAAEEGLVTQVSDDKDTGKTVVVQHAGGRVTVYGQLGQVKVAANDWVEAGQSLGELAESSGDERSLLFFAVKEKGRYVDPADVIPFD